MRYGIEFELTGKYALFTDPLMNLGGEKLSYQVPTYQALKGIVESIYWKPTLLIIVDEVRVMNRIQMESKGMRPIKYHQSGNELANYTYLKDVRYRVRAHFEFNPHRPDLAADRNEKKHFSMMKRALKAGGRRDIFLGARECQGYVEPCAFDEGEGFYDPDEEIYFGTMVHGINYPDETGRDQLEIRLWHPVMKNGVIKFPRPEQCKKVRAVAPYQAKKFDASNVQFVDHLLAELGGE